MPAEPTFPESDSLRHHPVWSPQQVLRDEQSFLRVTQKRARVAIAAVIASMGIVTWQAYEYVKGAFRPDPTVGVLSSGWVFGTDPVPYKLEPEQEAEIWKQVFEAHFARTEKGRIPGLEDYSTPDTLAGVDAMVARPDKLYLVSITAVDERLRDRSPDGTEALMYYRTRLTVVDPKNSATTEAFVAARFSKLATEGENATGWRMVGIRGIDRQEFYWRERDEARRKSLGLPAATENAP